ncbi:MAG: DsbA family protein [Alphaproteobacteria bacterium]|nr:DsbA family protein [Alphaproteobacteria bacterium]
MSDLVLTRRLALVGLSVSALAACGKSGGASGGGGALPDDMSMGNPNAKVTVVEYASVSCPVCGRWYRDNFATFKSKYIDTGKVHFIYREMLVGGTDEMAAAASGFLLARCAGTGNYFKVVDAIYNDQTALFSDPRGTLLNVAKSMGMTEAQFDSCTRDSAALDALTKRVQANAAKDNVNATPTFVVNGKALEAGYHPLSDLEAAIAAAGA